MMFCLLNEMNYNQWISQLGPYLILGYECLFVCLPASQPTSICIEVIASFGSINCAPFKADVQYLYVVFCSHIFSLLAQR